jgi:alanine dehydrogenase
MKIYSREETAKALEPEALLQALAKAFVDVSAGKASVPPRIAAAAPNGLLGAMTAYVPSLKILAAKLVSVFPHNLQLPTHQAVVIAFDPETGEPLAVMDGTEITAQRTASASALAAKLLSRQDSQVLSIVGTSVQAWWHAVHVGRVRKFREILIAGRDFGKARALAARVPLARAVSIEEAVSKADVLCATTHAQTPVIFAMQVKPGTHLSSVGFSKEGGELELKLFDQALIAIEARSSSFGNPPAGAPELRGRDPAKAVELGELLSGTRQGRTSPEQLTLYKSVGIAAEDAAAASLVLEGAK